MDRAKEKPYHHGSLRAALIAAGEAELAETGVADFSLRAVAKRVGVSHSAPAHHFGDAKGLLSLLAASGYERFLAAMEARAAAAEATPRARLIASGLAYVEFAAQAPALFKLMFASDRVKADTPELAAASAAAFGHLADSVAKLHGVSPFEDAAAMTDVIAAWSLVHGFAELVNAGRLKQIAHQSPAEREAFVLAMIERVFPPEPAAAAHDAGLGGGQPRPL
jgi:AcrR family transcriptional regulator